MSKRYTTQSEWDKNGIGDRFACAFTVPFLFCEHKKGRKGKDAEQTLYLGWCFRNLVAFMSNNADFDLDADAEWEKPKGWDGPGTPGWFYNVDDWNAAIGYAERALGVKLNRASYRIGVMRHQYGGIHYVGIDPQGNIMNPDPSLNGPIIEKRRLPGG